MPPPPPPPPEPPECLSPAAAAFWREMVASKPSTYFDAANQILLELLCTACAHSDCIAAQISKLDDIGDPKQLRLFSKWSIMAARQSKLITMLITKLRLLPRESAPMAAVTPVWERHRC